MFKKLHSHNPKMVTNWLAVRRTVRWVCFIVATIMTFTAPLLPDGIGVRVFVSSLSLWFAALILAVSDAEW